MKVNSFLCSFLAEKERMEAAVVCLKDEVPNVLKTCFGDCCPCIVGSLVGFDVFRVKGQFAVHRVTLCVSM